MKTIERKISGNKVKGILFVKDWFEDNQMPEIYSDFYVVASWFEYPDGQKDNVEGRETIAITRSYEHALKIYKDKSILSLDGVVDFQNEKISHA